MDLGSGVLNILVANRVL